MSVMEKAQVLGEALVNSKEYKELQGAQQQIGANGDAQSILQEFQAEQQKAKMAQMNGQEITQEMQNKLQGLQAKMQENDDIANLMETEKKFNEVMKTVNQVISSALSGKEEQDCGHDEECGGGCC